jgi:uncharacterized RDD family membrane protein YckC
MNYGGFWIRFLAYVVDGLIITIAFLAIVMLLGLMGLELISNELILFAMAVLYYAFMQASARQATYGKALLGLKVCGMNGERISLGRALAREVAKILSTATFLIGFVVAGLTRRKQALHDFIASTTVVRAAPGQVVVALALAVVALLAPFVVVFMFGAGLVAGALGTIAGVLLKAPEIAMHAPPKPAPPAKIVPVTVAIKPDPSAPAVKPAAMPVSAPVVVAQAPEPPKPAAAPREEPKPPVAETAKEQKPKPAFGVRKPPIKPDAPAAAPTAPEPPKAETQDAERQMVAPARAMAAPGPRYNDLSTAVIYGDAATVHELLGYGKWADKADSRGVTPLMLAAERGDGESAEALLKAGADPNRPGPGGVTATSIARERKNAAMMQLLQRYGGH